jgi:hypothetical protein
MTHPTQPNWSHRDLAEATIDHLLGQPATSTTLETILTNLFHILYLLEPSSIDSITKIDTKTPKTRELLITTCERVWQIFDERYPQITETTPGAPILSGIVRVPYGNRKTLGESQIRIRALGGYLQTDLTTEWGGFYAQRGEDQIYAEIAQRADTLINPALPIKMDWDAITDDALDWMGGNNAPKESI